MHFSSKSSIGVSYHFSVCLLYYFLQTNELCENLSSKGVRLMQLQQAAEMAVAHFSVPSTVKRFRRRQLGDVS